jgi:hypothetical protein
MSCGGRLRRRRRVRASADCCTNTRVRDERSPPNSQSPRAPHNPRSDQHPPSRPNRQLMHQYEVAARSWRKRVIGTHDVGSARDAPLSRFAGHVFCDRSSRHTGASSTDFADPLEDCTPALCRSGPSMWRACFDPWQCGGDDGGSHSRSGVLQAQGVSGRRWSHGRSADVRIGCRLHPQHGSGRRYGHSWSAGDHLPTATDGAHSGHCRGDWSCYRINAIVRRACRIIGDRLMTIERVEIVG